MLYYDGTYIFEGIDTNKTNHSYEFKTFHYNYVSRINLNFQPNICNGYYDFLQKIMGVNKIVIISVPDNMYKIHFEVRVKMKVKIS